MEEDDHLDRKISREEAAVKPTRSFRYEDYKTRRVFLRSYPLHWSPSPAPADEKLSMDDDDGGAAGGDDERGGSGRWKTQQVVVAVAEWGEEKLLLLRRVKKRLAMYLIGCHYGRPALPFKSGGGRGSCAAAMLSSR